jgi:lipoprotein-releasing system ATP-binding protein
MKMGHKVQVPKLASPDNLYKLFFDIRSKYNTTFIIVTHNEKLANLADRKIEITDGIINK